MNARTEETHSRQKDELARIQRQIRAIVDRVRLPRSSFLSKVTVLAAGSFCVFKGGNPTVCFIC
jgi:hypothetical protein